MEISICRLAIFASGTGSNARNFCNYFRNNPYITVTLLLTNREDSGVAAIAEEYNLPYMYFDRTKFYHSQDIVQFLESQDISLIILAGFLWLIPQNLLQTFPNRIINIHPALLPKYGGKGMYGMHVHESVIVNKEKESGITIHLVNEHYDEGRILAQYKVPINGKDTPEILANKIHTLEYKYYPVIVEKYAVSL